MHISRDHLNFLILLLSDKNQMKKNITDSPVHSKIKLLFHISNNKATTLIFTPSTYSHDCISHHVVCRCTGTSTCDVISQFSPLSTCVLFWFFVFPVSIRFFTCRHFTQFLSQPLQRSALCKEVLSEEKKCELSSVGEKTFTRTVDPRCLFSV